jgi:hypothetical protein
MLAVIKLPKKNKNMRKESFILLTFLIVGNFGLYSQISFIKFDIEQYGLLAEHNYTYENDVICGSNCSGYKIYYDGIEVHSNYPYDYGYYSVEDLLIINDSVGFMVEWLSDWVGHKVNKTNNYGHNWNFIGGGAYYPIGLYIVNKNTGYLITSSSLPSILYITRVSDIQQRMITINNVINDTVIADTIFGEPFCEIDTLSFDIKNGSDTIKIRISLHQEPLSINDDLKQKNFQIFPNPANDFFTFELDDNGIEEFEIRIYDNMGKIVKSPIISNRKIQINHLSQGIYLVKILFNNDRFVSKLIKN